MTKLLNYLPQFCLTAVLSLGLVAAGCSKKTPDAPADKAADKPAEKAGEKAAESRVKRGTNGNPVITIEEDIQKTIGLEIAALTPSDRKPEVQGFGKVLDITPLVAGLSDLASADAALKASEAEVQRLKTLSAQGNAAPKTVQTAEAAAAHDKAQMDSARLRLLASWGGPIADQKDLPALVQGLASQKMALVQINLTAEATVRTNGAPLGARLLRLPTGTPPVAAEFLGTAPVVDPQFQGQGYLFLVRSNTAGLAPGQMVSGYVIYPGEAETGVNIPSAAIVRYNGTAWIYVPISANQFERREVPLVSPTTNGWFAQAPFTAADKVVVSGAHQLLSEEVKDQVSGD
jgi:hypothetical protein